MTKLYVCNVSATVSDREQMIQTILNTGGHQMTRPMLDETPDDMLGIIVRYFEFKAHEAAMQQAQNQVPQPQIYLAAHGVLHSNQSPAKHVEEPLIAPTLNWREWREEQISQQNARQQQNSRSRSSEPKSQAIDYSKGEPPLIAPAIDWREELKLQR
jgi:hypothetical protein